MVRSVRAKHLPKLIEALGGSPEEDILDVLAREATDDHGYELERRLRKRVVPSNVFVR